MADEPIDMTVGGGNNAAPPAAETSITPSPTAGATEPTTGAPPPSAQAEAAPQPAADDKPVVAAEVPTLLEDFDAAKAGDKKDAKPAEAKEPAAEAAPEPKEGDKKPAEAQPEKKPDAAEAKPEAKESPQVEPPQQLEPIEYAFEMPPEIKADDPRMNQFREVLQSSRVPAENAQQFLNLHTEAMREYATYLANEQQRIFADTRRDWRNQIMADEVLGGAGHQTAMTRAAMARDALVPEADRQAFGEFLRMTGAGDHPAFIRLLHRAARYVSEPQAAEFSTEIKPPPNNGRAPGSRRGLLYDHPSSNKQ